MKKAIKEKTNKYAKYYGGRLLRIIEEYLKFLASNERKKLKSSPLVKSLWGSIKPPHESEDYKGLLEEEIIKKHLR